MGRPRVSAHNKLSMSIRKVSIGRNPRSDIRLDEGHIYASKHHGEIYYDGYQMIYRDMSTNGTMINRTMVKHRSVPLQRGDIIMLAGRYLLDWNAIDAFVPTKWAGGTVFGNQDTVHATSTASGMPQTMHIDVDAWNWGAMGLYPLWGVFNGCWWTLPVGIAIGWLFPLPNLVFGRFGTQWALQGRQWNSMQEFIDKQKQWRLAGIITMGILSLLFIWWVSASASYLFKT